MSQMPEIKSTRDALDLAYLMLKIVEDGGTFSAKEWYERMQELEKWLTPAITQHERLHEMFQNHKRGK